ncbi:hypothetical protein [Bradyrhizobium sp. RT4b]
MEKQIIVKRDLGRLVQQGEPKAVDAIMAQGQGDDRAAGEA